MWTKSYSTVVKNIDAKKLWNVWTDVNNWDKWQDDIEFAKLETSFHSGSIIKFRPKGGPTVDLHLIEVEAYKVFTDLTKFPLAKMYDKHEMIAHDDGIEIKTTISIGGPLAFVWRKIVGENIVKSLPDQTMSLIRRTKTL